MESGARLIEGEALEALKVMWAGSFCLFVADPPYLLDRMPRVRRRHLRAMDGGGLDWGRLFRELYRVMRQDSALLLFGHLSSFLRLAPLAESVGLGYVTDIVWVKPVPVNFLQARKKPLSRHELITVWRKGKLRYNWEEAAEPGKPYASGTSGQCDFYDVKMARRANPGIRFMTDVIEAPNKPCMPREERTPHPTQKPLALIRKLVKAFSFPGECVLDPFAGSGTTMVACRELGRECVGIEIDPEYAEMIRRRMLEVFEAAL
ncbi:MAG: site-specific DNA-methyltransferase [Candidatus Methanomethyliaceae archaeon]|nr:site-specific DNA-methyltransferase [Candidatus Methanomethyliaceae archaeon]